MAKKKRKPTQLQQQYEQQVKRIKRAIKEQEKRGYYDIQYTLPERPERITRKAVESLKAVTPAKIRETASYMVVETGEEVTGTEGFKVERQRSAQKAARTRHLKRMGYYDSSDRKIGTGEPPQLGEVVYYNFTTDLLNKLSEDFPDRVQRKNGKYSTIERNTMQLKEQARTTLISIVKRRVQEIGENGVGLIIKENETIVWDAIEAIWKAYLEPQVTQAFEQLARILNGQPFTLQESMELHESLQNNIGFEVY